MFHLAYPVIIREQMWPVPSHHCITADLPTSFLTARVNFVLFLLEQKSNILQLEPERNKNHKVKEKTITGRCSRDFFFSSITPGLNCVFSMGFLLCWCKRIKKKLFWRTLFLQILFHLVKAKSVTWKDKILPLQGENINNHRLQIIKIKGHQFEAFQLKDSIVLTLSRRTISPFNYEIIKVLYVKLAFFNCLFVFRFNLPPRIARQGQQGMLRVFCSQSFSRLFCDEVVAYKSMKAWAWGVRARGPMLIHCSLQVQRALVNTANEMKRLEKCEYWTGSTL